MKIINIDALKPEATIVIKSNGKDHEMATLSVGGFLANLQDIERISAKQSPAEELDATLDVILRSFPTLTREEIKAWPLAAIAQIYEVAQNGGNDVGVEDEDGEKETPEGNVSEG